MTTMCCFPPRNPKAVPKSRSSWSLMGTVILTWLMPARNSILVDERLQYSQKNTVGEKRFIVYNAKGIQDQPFSLKDRVREAETETDGQEATLAEGSIRANEATAMEIDGATQEVLGKTMEAVESLRVDRVAPLEERVARMEELTSQAAARVDAPQEVAPPPPPQAQQIAPQKIAPQQIAPQQSVAQQNMAQPMAWYSLDDTDSLWRTTDEPAPITTTNGLKRPASPALDSLAKRTRTLAPSESTQFSQAVVAPQPQPFATYPAQGQTAEVAPQAPLQQQLPTGPSYNGFTPASRQRPSRKPSRCTLLRPFPLRWFLNSPLRKLSLSMPKLFLSSNLLQFHPTMASHRASRLRPSNKPSWPLRCTPPNPLPSQLLLNTLSRIKVARAGTIPSALTPSSEQTSTLSFSGPTASTFGTRIPI